MIYLYAFTDLEQLVAPLRGLEEAAVELVRCGRVAAALVPLDTAPAPEPAVLWGHERVVEALMAQGAVLPVRFGTTLPDRPAAAALLDRHEQVLLEGLERVRGAVEVGLRIHSAAAGPPEEAPPPASGREYLLRQRAQVHDLVTAAERVHGQLRAAARAAVSRPGNGRGQLLVGAYLVERDRVEAFVDRIRAADEATQPLRLLSTGPWPPYHFVPTLEEPDVAR